MLVIATPARSSKVKALDFFLQIYHRLTPGEVMTVDNWRMVHGRTEIKANGGIRQMEVSKLLVGPFLNHSLYSLLSFKWMST